MPVHRLTERFGIDADAREDAALIIFDGDDFQALCGHLAGFLWMEICAKTGGVWMGRASRIQCNRDGLFLRLTSRDFRPNVG